MITYCPQLPEKSEIHQLFQTTGWKGIVERSENEMHEAISKSWFAVSAYDGRQLIGFGRVLSDGIFQAFICDLIVHPAYQGQRIGSVILKALLTKCKETHIVSVQLCCAKGKSGFYQKFGFSERAPEAPGMYWSDRELK